MHSTPTRRIFGVLIATLLFAGAAEARNLLNCGTLPSLMERYRTLHVSQRPHDAEFVDRVAKIYLDRFDSSKALLTAPQAKQVSDQVRAFFAGVQQGQCAVMQAIKADQLARHQEMEAFVQKMVGDDKFAIDRTIELVMDADKRPRAKDGAERDALRAKLVHFQMANYVASGTKLEEARGKLTKRYALITKRVREMDDADLFTGLLDAYAAAFDPHTTYFSAEALEDFRIGMALSLEGIGAVLRSRDGFTMVHEVVKGGAADRQGQLKRKDRIIAVSQGDDGEPVDVVDMALRDVVRLIRGKKGTTVRLTVLRQGKKTLNLTIPIVRDKIDLKEQAARLRWKEVDRGGRKLKLAVLDLPSFYGSSRPGGRQCADDVANLLEAAKAGGADGLVLDLASNSGGLLQHAVDITGFFVRRGGVVSIEGVDGQAKVLKDVDQRIQYAGPLVVLTSRLSASASEILAGAVKDYARGLIVGDEHTFGKGTVQNVVNLPEGFGALKVTTALFFRPGGQSTQRTGVEADIQVRSPFDSDQYGEKNHDFALPGQTTKPFRSDAINIEGVGGWTPVTAALIASLSAKSAQRVAGNAELAKVAEEIKKSEAREGIMKVAEILDDKDRKDDEDDAPKEDDDKFSPQLLEGLEVLADLVEAGGTLAAKAKPNAAQHETP